MTLDKTRRGGIEKTGKMRWWVHMSLSMTTLNNNMWRGLPIRSSGKPEHMHMNPLDRSYPNTIVNINFRKTGLKLELHLLQYYCPNCLFQFLMEKGRLA